MASGLKIKALAGLGKQSAFGTGVAATQDLPFISESLKAEHAPAASQHRQGGRAVELLGLGPITCGGQLVEPLRYLLTTDPAHVLLEQAFGQAWGHVYRNLTRESWVPLRNGAADNVELAISVTPATAASAGVQVRLFLKRVGSPSGNLSVEIQTDSTGDPSGTPVANGTSATVSAAGISTVGEWVTFTFASSPSLAAATPYHIVLKGTYAASATDQIQMAVEDVASGGTFEIKDAAWANDTTKYGVGRVLTTSFVDSYLMADSIEGLFATLAIDKGVAVHEFLGLKVKDCTLRSAPADGLRATYDLVGYDEDLSPTNSAALLAGLTRSRTYILHKDLTACWVGDQADVLVSGDHWSLDSWQLKLTRPLDAQPVAGQRQILEPLENGQGSVMLTVSLPRYASEQWRTWQNAGTQLQGRFQWTLGSSYLSVLIPHMVIDGAVAIETGDAAPYSQQATLRCFKNGATNGLLAVQDECELTILNV